MHDKVTASIPFRSVQACFTPRISIKNMRRVLVHLRYAAGFTIIAMRNNDITSIDMFKESRLFNLSLTPPLFSLEMRHLLF